MTNMSFLNRILLSVACVGALAVVGCATTDHASTHVHAAAPLTQKSVPVKANIGYTNTPIIPGTSWHVHDGTRPQPRIVTSGISYSQAATMSGHNSHSKVIGAKRNGHNLSV